MNPIHLPGTPAWLWWAYPWVFSLLVLLPLLWWLWLRAERRTVIRYSGLSAVRAAGGAVSRRARLILPTLRMAALVCLIVAVARPQRPDESRRVFAEGVAIELVVDISGSMEDPDLSLDRNHPVSRWAVVREIVKRFVRGESGGELSGRENDLIGLIRFARYPDAVCPLTLDHDALVGVLDETGIVTQREENATSIGDALGLAVERLREVQRTAGSGAQLNIKSRVVILLTDGENNDGVLSPGQAGELAATYGIKVYTILAGTGQNTGFGLRRPVDDSELRHIAEVSGGKHYLARDQQALQDVYADIDQLERTKVEERTNLRWGELSHGWLLAAFACLSLQMFLDSTRMRKTP
jgi:Ca-activated chloride channel family protein